MVLPSVKSHLKYYRSQHRTLGCKITHLFGVPMIVLSIPLMFFDWKRSVTLFSCGWILQFIGHYFFEKNKPVLLSKKRHPLVLLSAIVYVSTEWLDTVRSVREELFDSSNGGEPRLTKNN